MTAARLKIGIFLSYAIFAILLNSVGTVILQSIEYFRIDKVTASTLEAFKDLPIAITSFLIASFLPRIGYRRGMIVGLAVVGAACTAMPLINAFWGTRLLFFAIGVSFAIVKVAVYSSVGLLTETRKEHASLLNVIEGVFMLGVLGGYWIFAAFIDHGDPSSPRWLQVYWVLAAACAAAIVVLATARFDESRAHDEVGTHSPASDFGAMLRLAARPLTIVFIVSVFLYVLIEQGIGTWLPTFNRQLLGLSAPMSVQAASIFAVGLAVGRLGAGAIVRRTGWYPLLIACLGAMAVLIVVALPLANAASGEAVDSWAGAPVAAFVFPLIGLFMAPIYPAINSAILSAMPPANQSSMVGLIVVFSALGGTTGSFIIGRVFAAFEGAGAFYLLLIPIAVVAISITALKRLTDRAA
ncbi:sugar MFS transporter [Sphingomonas sp. LaA6.9]|uniref:MFS transporter n=1 Tax=Sphingomonas sp. LaA6.9 TaxID=2919914 RepID=UPI001F4F26D7|nr:MFS transporter [Sphingomonas sp. LaA6.9]MCJ8156741.1 MFS transporter [Sphingomonas sp. LaA6.9]